ncbi:hypothetical protein ACM39_07785 [Chryseobacterium sp. FH2]|uniref:hypothetical protein n=1 Tax=Chryseobacterium sp. FH2 TaxID=1674291 RepID=UPI00065AE94D|nr:hypothetical protein [Chryseobacterium sp. FH2]KMQ68409.1 hypothetical protein ACM39_07785 [Chryseobacterium sp. FH2]
MKNNPFITVFLLFCIEATLLIFLDYIDFMPVDGELMLIFLCFTVPVISVLISVFSKDLANKKAFRYFSFFILMVAIIIFAALSYLSALGKAYQH